MPRRISPENEPDAPDPEFSQPTLGQILAGVEELKTMLARIEERQIKTTKMVEEVEKEEQTHHVGSFGTVDPGHKSD